MERTTPSGLSPRKKPRQARAAVTVDAIFEACIQLLISDGLDRLTTTRVAERAGVSVGTMYQYFPHKHALIYALNERYLEALAARVEARCAALEGAPIGDMVEALIDTYWQAKMERMDATLALYQSMAGLNNEALIAAFVARVDTATSAMFDSAGDPSIADIQSVNLTLVTVIFGAVRHVFERRLSREEAEPIRRQLILMCRTYLASVTREADIGTTNCFPAR